MISEERIQEALETVAEKRALVESDYIYMREDSHPALLEVGFQRMLRWDRVYETLVQLVEERKNDHSG